MGAVPHGHDLGPDGVDFIENPTEQAVIEDIRSMRSGGSAFQQIADALTERGVLAKTSRFVRGAHTAVRRILIRC